MNKIRFIMVLVGILVSGFARADVAIAGRYVADAELVGKARMKVMLWNVFDARLYASDGQFEKTQPFALSLSYLRELSGSKIVSTTIDEMTKQRLFDADELVAWERQLKPIIADVDSKTTITGIRDENGHTLFYRNGQRVGRIANERFTLGFFNIWLGESTSQPALRKKLVGT